MAAKKIAKKTSKKPTEEKHLEYFGEVLDRIDGRFAAIERGLDKLARVEKPAADVVCGKCGSGDFDAIEGGIRGAEGLAHWIRCATCHTVVGVIDAEPSNAISCLESQLFEVTSAVSELQTQIEQLKKLIRETR